MSEPNENFYRIQKLPPYVFAVINEMKAKARAAQLDVVDLGMGNPDGATPPRRRRQADRSGAQSPQSPLLRVARHSSICARKSSSATSASTTSISIPNTEAIVTIGAKDALAHLMFAIIGPGDVVVSPNPAYPIHQYGVIMAEGHACMLPMPDAETFLGRLEELYRESPKPPKMLLISFPHNPTTTCVDLEFMTRNRAIWRGTRHPDRPRFRLCRSGLRRLQAAQHPRSCRARRTSRSRSSPCRRATTWRAGALDSVWATRR